MGIQNQLIQLIGKMYIDTLLNAFLSYLMKTNILNPCQQRIHLLCITCITKITQLLHCRFSNSFFLLFLLNYLDQKNCKFLVKGLCSMCTLYSFTYEKKHAQQIVMATVKPISLFRISRQEESYKNAISCLDVHSYLKN